MENHLQKRIFKFSAITAAMLFVFACATPQRKLNKLLDKHPELKHTETIIVRDTIRDTIRAVAPGVEAIKEFDFASLKDTVYIDTNQLHVKIWTNISQDTVFVDANCDTLYIDVPIEIPIAIPVDVEKIIYRKPRDRLRWFLYGLMCGSVIVLFMWLYKADQKQNTKE